VICSAVHAATRCAFAITTLHPGSNLKNLVYEEGKKRGSLQHEQLSNGRSKGQIENHPTLLPARKGFSAEFYITSQGASSVRILPEAGLEPSRGTNGALCPHNGNNQKLLVRAKYFGQTVAMNNQDSVQIPIVLRRSAHMKGGVDILDYLNYLEVWNHGQFLKNLKSSPITAQDKKMLSKLSSAPRFPRTIRRNKEEGHVHGTEMRFRIHGRVRPDARGQAGQALTRARHLVHKTERRARGRKHQSKFFSSQCGQKSLSECVCPLTGMVGQGRKHP